MYKYDVVIHYFKLNFDVNLLFTFHREMLEWIPTIIIQ